jgi:hypothetical protein
MAASRARGKKKHLVTKSSSDDLPKLFVKLARVW